MRMRRSSARSSSTSNGISETAVVHLWSVPGVAVATIPVVTTRAVVFDLDDTLIIEVSYAMASLHEALGTLPGVDPVASEQPALDAVRSVWTKGADYQRCVELGFASWEGLWSTFEGNHHSVDGLITWAPIYRAEAWRAVGVALGIDDPGLLAIADRRFEDAQRRGHPIIEGMHDVIAEVGTHHPMGLITNGPSDIQRLKLEQAELASTFAAEVISGELGVGKPEPEVFLGLLERLGATPEASLMVGDSWERDIEGGLAAGMSAVWISDGRTPPADLSRVTVIDSVRQLVDVLG
jgi:putative hydrolase of the HAD superfamily